MSIDYEAGVFYGACFPRDSEMGRKLDAYIERQGGTPAATEVPGVQISMVGCQSSGKVWLTVEAAGSTESYGKHDEMPAPVLLTEDPVRRLAIERFLERLGQTSVDIGWHFQGSTS